MRALLVYTEILAVLILLSLCVDAGITDCASGYRFDRMSGVGCVQTDCRSVPHAFYNYVGYCVCYACGEVGCSGDKDFSKECRRAPDDKSCPSCVYMCINPKDRCPGEKNAQSGSGGGGAQTTGTTLKQAGILESLLGSKNETKNETYDWKISGKIIGFDHPMKYLKLVFMGEEKIETATDANGHYDIDARKLQKGKEYELQLQYKYLRDGKNYFVLHVHNETEPVKLSFILADKKIKTVKYYMTPDITGSIDVDEKDFPSELNLNDYCNEDNGQDTFVSMFIHFTEALEFYKEYLKENMDFQLPLNVYTFIGKGVKYQYEGSKSWIAIDARHSVHDTETRPISREYHEFSHYAMHALYKKWPEPPAGSIKEVNHDGYINPSTSDSYVEGFAVFMSTIMGQHYGRWWTKDNDNVGDKGASDCPGMGSLEVNFKPWQYRGLAEEMAIAGILWDIYDGQAEAQSDAANLRDFYTKVYETLVKDHDYNGNKVFDRNELITMALFDKSHEEAGDNLEMRDVIRLTASFKYVNDSVDVAPVMGHYDKNADGVLNGDELTEFAKTMLFKGYSYGDYHVKDAIIEAYDKNGDGVLDKSEFLAFESGEQLRKDLMEEYDNDEDGELSGKELFRFVSENEDGLAAIYQDTSDQGNPGEKFTDTVPKKITLDYFLNNMPKNEADDDKVNVPFEQIWPILRVYHPDFTSVYKAFTDKYKDRKADIDRIAISHGFFVDKKRGNGKRDEDEPYRSSGKPGGDYKTGDYFIDYPAGGFKYDNNETIGSASNYQRLERQSLLEIPGQYIKVDNNVPFYDITIIYRNPNKPLTYILPERVYQTRSRNDNGLVHVPIPPPGYDAEITVEAEGVKTKSPLTFTSNKFNSEFLQAMDKGYYVEHDFKVEGKIPPQPVIPKALETENEKQNQTCSCMPLLTGILALLTAAITNRI